MNAIAINSQIVADVVADPALKRRLSQIDHAVGRPNRKIEDLLDFSRLEARQLRLDRVPTALRSLVDESVERARLAAPERSFRMETRGETARVLADPVRIAQVMDNLLSNAIKYGAAGTPILVDVDATPEGVTVAVTNQGEDIAPEDLTGLFRRFTRTDAVRRSAIKGLGLGLYITRALVEAHGGAMSARSGGGRTTFWLRLPTARAREVHPS